jgi:spermidine synthase
MLTERDEFVYHEMISHVPLVAHPNPKHTLIIGGGDGGTVREILKHTNIEKIDLVEIDNEVIDSCIQYLPNISHGLNDPKVQIFIEDGIKFIEEKHNIFDLIIIDSTDPIGPAEGLFETKFYSSVYKALKSDGIMVTQSESPFQDKNLWSKIYKDISSVFPMAFSYLAYIPTYPSGMWSFTIGSKSVHPVNDMRNDVATDLSLKTLYYNPSVHKSAFSLPNFLHSELESIS